MPRTLYKLTNSNMITQNNTQWVLGEWKETDGIQRELCNSSWLHAYEDPYVAAFMYVIHVYYSNPRCFLAEGDGAFLSDGTKCGVTRLRLVEEIPLPTITKEQRIKIAILCALEVCYEASFVTWANNWLSGKDRSTETSNAAYYYIDANANAAYADYAARAAAWAAAWAASNAACADYADYADYAARAAADTAYNATYAAAQALQSKSFDLSAIIQKVLQEENK
jgi:hypothetical protein